MKELFRFTVSGTIPSKKNQHEIRMNQNIHYGAKPKVWIAPSEEYQNWELVNALELRNIFYKKFKAISYPIFIEYIFHAPDKRRFDLSNKIESIQDMMVKSGILKDDNAFIICDYRAHLGKMSTTGKLEVEVVIFKTEFTL